MAKRHFLGGRFSTKCHKKCRFGTFYENISHRQEWKNCKKFRFGTSYDHVHEKLPKVCKLKKNLKITTNVLRRFFVFVQLIFDLLNKNFLHFLNPKFNIIYNIQ